MKYYSSHIWAFAIFTNLKDLKFIDNYKNILKQELKLTIRHFLIFPHISNLKKRNEFLLKEGEICKHYYFVNNGCIRLFSVNEQGEEGTKYFHFEDAFSTALPSLINQKPSFEFMQTIEASELLVINRDDYFHLVEKVPQFAFVYRQILESAYIKSQERIYCFQKLEAIEKVRWVLTNQAKWLTRLSNKMVASYLGLTPQTLSRLKSKV